MHYLRAHDEVGADIEARDRADRSQTLGADALDDARFTALVEQAGADGDEDTFRYLYRRVQRERCVVGHPARTAPPLTSIDTQTQPASAAGVIRRLLTQVR